MLAFIGGGVALLRRALEVAPPACRLHLKWTEGRLLPRQLARRLWPFATVAWFGVLLLPMPGHPIHAGWYAVGTALTAAVTLSVIWAPWHRAPVASRCCRRSPTSQPLGRCAMPQAATRAASAHSFFAGPLGCALRHAPRARRRPAPASRSRSRSRCSWSAPPTTRPLAGAAASSPRCSHDDRHDRSAPDHPRCAPRPRPHAPPERERERLFAQVEELARTDPLTGVGNRRAWADAVERALTNATRRELPSRSHCSTWMGSRRSTTPPDTTPATSRCRNARRRGPRSCAPATPSPASAATSSASCSRTATRSKPGSSSTACATSRPVASACSAGVAEWDRAESADQWQRRADAELYAAKHPFSDVPHSPCSYRRRLGCDVRCQPPQCGHAYARRSRRRRRPRR